MTTSLNLQRTLQDMKQELAALVKERENLRKQSGDVERRIAALRQSIDGLLEYAGNLQDGGGSQWGKFYKAIRDVLAESSALTSLTEACRKTVRDSLRPLSAIEVRDLIEASGFSFAAYQSNPLSSIHTTLGRLRDSNEILEKVQDGAKFYVWLHKSEPPSASLGSRIPENRISQPTKSKHGTRRRRES